MYLVLCNLCASVCVYLLGATYVYVREAAQAADAFDDFNVFV